MVKNLEYYIKSYHLIDKNTCQLAIKDMETIEWEEHSFYNYIDGSYEKLGGNDELEFGFSEAYSKTLIANKVKEAFVKYISEIDFPWFHGLRGFTDLRFNRYKKTKKMAEHCDHIHSMFDGKRKGIPTLSALGLLNNNFSGGEFVMFGDTLLSFDIGEIKIFPSNFLYPHRVNPVTEGTRYTFVSWAW